MRRWRERILVSVTDWWSYYISSILTFIEFLIAYNCMAQNQTDNLQPLALSLQPTHHIPLPTRLFHSFANTSFNTSGTDLLTPKNIPIFNDDKQHFTPTFTLGIDQVCFLLCRATIRPTENSRSKSLWIKLEGSPNNAPTMYLPINLEYQSSWPLLRFLPSLQNQLHQLSLTHWVILTQKVYQAIQSKPVYSNAMLLFWQSTSDCQKE